MGLSPKWLYRPLTRLCAERVTTHSERRRGRKHGAMSLLQRSILRLPPSGSWPQYDNDPESPWHDAEAIAAYHDARIQAEEDLAAEDRNSLKRSGGSKPTRVRRGPSKSSNGSRESLVVKLASHLGVKTASMHRRASSASKPARRASVAPLDERGGAPGGVEPLVRAMETRGKVRAKTIRARVTALRALDHGHGRDGNASEAHATAEAQHSGARLVTRDEIRAVYPEVGG